jgi:hypothetical protein
MWQESRRVEWPILAADGCKNLLAKNSGKKRKLCRNIKGLFRKRNMAVRILQGQPGSPANVVSASVAPEKGRQWRTGIQV